ncbi:MAG TPA: MerR family transcriptional regulator [Acidimicrobiales bacterium]|jgi:DNA-binding transcriptional MerR regulator|nr:MerR family transcriptional regulator [Acidimicrobiales bacterium]
MPEDGYRGPQVCKIVGITYRQLDYWARTDLLRPSISEARGSGTQRIYSYRDLLELKVIKRLLDAGVSLHSARRALEVLRRGGVDVATANLVLNGAQSVLATSGEEIIDLLKGGQGVLNIVPLAGVVEELQAAITELAPGTGKASPAAGGRDEGGGLPRAGTGG